MGMAKKFLKLRCFLFQTQENHKKLLIKHKFAKWTHEIMQMSYIHCFDCHYEHFYPLNKKIYRKKFLKIEKN